MKSSAFTKMGRRTQAPPISWLMKLALDHPALISLAAGFTDNESLPVEEARALLNEILGSRKTGRGALQYGTTVGDAPLRRLTAERVAKLDSAAMGAPASTSALDDSEPGFKIKDARQRSPAGANEIYSPERMLITSGS